VIENCSFAYIADISASKVQRYLAERRRQGLSIRSSNFYLQAIKQFCRWLVADNRTAESSLAYLTGQNPKTDIRHARRALSVDELDRLITSTLKGQKHSNMTGKERAMLYILAVSTGLRAGELASLTWQSFNLNNSTPSVTVLAAYSKHRRDDVQPLRLDIAQQLAHWKAEQGIDEQSKVFGNFRVNKAAKMLRRDLAAVGILYKDEAGRAADFHSLRHTFISNLTRSGVSPKIAQSLARHSTIGLTMDTYTHIGLYDERAAIDSLPKLPDLDMNERRADEAVAVRTGTDEVEITSDKSAYQCAYKKLTKNAYSDSNRSSATGNEENEKRKSAQSDKSLAATKLGNERNYLSTLDTGENNRRRSDSNRRITVLQTVALNRLATPPKWAR
jgi:integrase